MAAKLSVLQLFFAITWVVYVIYLPALAAQAGIDKRHVPLILMMDQAIFVACDWAAGVYADRVGRLVGRIGRPMAVATLASCAAFLAMPWVAPAAGATAFLALTAFWSATSSALRAPPLALVSRHAPAPQQSWLAGLYLLGLGVAGALAPYLGLALKGVDPRLPFAAASVAVAVFALMLARAERGFTPKASSMTSAPPEIAPSRIGAFALAALLFGVGFQIHFAVNTAPAFLRVAAQEQLPQLMPVFWIGFNLAVLPATWLPRRFGGMPVMAAGGALGVAALLACAGAATLEALVAAQLVAGAAWGVALTAAFTAALEAGRPGREGLVTGLLFSMLAVAAFLRLAAVASGVPAAAVVADVPPYAWVAAVLVAIWLALRLR